MLVDHREVPRALHGLYEHRPETGADPLQPSAQRHPVVPHQPPEGHQGPGRHVGGAGGDLQQHAHRQGAGGVGGQVLPLAQAPRQLHHRLHVQVCRHPFS